MAVNNTTFTPTTKQKGDFILAQEWNGAMSELVQLRTALANQKIETIAGDLKVGGSLGVGAATPQAKLHVMGQGGANIDLIVNGRLQSNNNDGGLWVASDRFVGGHSTNQLGLWNGNAWRLTVRPDGNVGIGTTAPRAKLDVSGGKIQLDGNQQVIFADGDTTNNLKLQLWNGFGLGINPSTLFYAANGRHSWRDSNGATERMALTTAANGGLTVLGTGASSFAGNLGLGTDNPGTYRLSVNGAARLGGVTDYGAAAVVSVAPGTVNFDAPNIVGGRLVIDGATGNVGIGNVKPTAKLHVNGNSTISGALTVQGAVTAASYAGDGSALTGIDALSKAGGELSGDLGVAGTVKATRFEGDGSALTGIALPNPSPWLDKSDGTGIVYRVGKNVTIGAANSGTSLQILNKGQDATGDTLILGRTEGSHLRLGYHSTYSWIQSQSAADQPPTPLAINPLGGNVGLGTADAKSKLHVSGGYLTISNQEATSASAIALLTSLPANSVVAGNASANGLIFYWKAGDGKLYSGSLTGVEVTAS
ncbi:MAG: hypothetical protein KDE46_05490 [Caldilineaceae bacterium]|nr:hypothetical protein [Caldilineaceae bacterium]